MQQRLIASLLLRGRTPAGRAALTLAADDPTLAARRKLCDLPLAARDLRDRVSAVLRKVRAQALRVHEVRARPLVALTVADRPLVALVLADRAAHATT
jgi:hypothetical protein